MEAKLDDILTSIRQLDRKLDSVDNTVKGIQEDLRSVKFDVAQHDDKIRVLEEQMGQLRCSNNILQQQQRSLTLRLFNANLGPESDDIKGRVYECLKPVLAAAKAAKDLTSLPQVASVIEACFRPPSSDPNVSPPIIIKVPNKSIKIALLKHKKHLPQPMVGPGPLPRPKLLLVEDLTPDTHRLFNTMVKSKKVGKVWTIEGQIKFTLPNETRIRTVASVYDKLEDIIKP